MLPLPERAIGARYSEPLNEQLASMVRSLDGTIHLSEETVCGLPVLDDVIVAVQCSFEFRDNQELLSSNAGKVNVRLEIDFLSCSGVFCTC